MMWLLSNDFVLMMQQVRGVDIMETSPSDLLKLVQMKSNPTWNMKTWSISRQSCLTFNQK